MRNWTTTVQHQVPSDELPEEREEEEES